MYESKSSNDINETKITKVKKKVKKISFLSIKKKYFQPDFGAEKLLQPDIFL